MKSVKLFAVVLSMLSTQAFPASCSLTSPALDFGSYDPLAATTDDATGVVQVSCSRTFFPAETVSYTLSASVGNGASYTARRMLRGAEGLSYNVYRNSARTQVWGDGSSGTSVFSGSYTLNNGNPTRSRNHTVYGRIPALQDVSAGVYSDTLITTLAF